MHFLEGGGPGRRCQLMVSFCFSPFGVLVAGGFVGSRRGVNGLKWHVFGVRMFRFRFHRWVISSNSSKVPSVGKWGGFNIT